MTVSPVLFFLFGATTVSREMMLLMMMLYYFTILEASDAVLMRGTHTTSD